MSDLWCIREETVTSLSLDAIFYIVGRLEILWWYTIDRFIIDSELSIMVHAYHNYGSFNFCLPRYVDIVYK